jgi:hypothetical protein
VLRPFGLDRLHVDEQRRPLALGPKIDRLTAAGKHRLVFKAVNGRILKNRVGDAELVVHGINVAESVYAIFQNGIDSLPKILHETPYPAKRSQAS